MDSKMNIEIVAESLRNTILGKEEALVQLQERKQKMQASSDLVALSATIDFLTINIGELKYILEDIEVCCLQYNELLLQVSPPDVEPDKPKYINLLDP
jgi:hypothetical protein